MGAIVTTFLLVLAATAHAGQFTVTEVYDGDTFKAEGHDIEIVVRRSGTLVRN
jgi:hypothetical protein